MNDFSEKYNHFEATCKICGRAITLKIDPNYNALSDPSRLIPLATCDSCFDLRMTGVKLHRMIVRMRVRLNLELLTRNHNEEQIRKQLEFCRVLSDKLLAWIPEMRKCAGSLDRIFLNRTPEGTILYGNVGNWAAMIEHAYNQYFRIIQECEQENQTT